MPACPLVDCHTHTSFSDGHASFEDNVRAAAAAGCRVMVSTDHLTLPASTDANCEVQVVEGDLPAHRLAFEDARKLAAQIAPELELIYALGFGAAYIVGAKGSTPASAISEEVEQEQSTGADGIPESEQAIVDGGSSSAE